MSLVWTSLLLLGLSGSVVVDGIRANFGKLMTDSASTSDSEQSESVGWCNPFSGWRTKYYHFDVRNSGDDCETGNCLAMLLIRNRSDPVLEINHGSSWYVNFKDGSDRELDWQLVHQNPNAEVKKQVLRLHHVHEITYKQGNEEYGLSDILDIKYGDDEEIQISGGLFYDEDLVVKGLRKMAEKESNMTDEALDATQVDLRGKDGTRKDNIIEHAGKWGWNMGAGLGLTGFAGGATALSAMGVGLAGPGQMLIGAMLGLVGGFGAGGVIGLGIGAMIGLAGMAGMVDLVRDHGLSAADKVWIKLSCLNGFHTCYEDVVIDAQVTALMVPRDESCDRKQVKFADNCARINGATRTNSMPFPYCKCAADDHELYCEGRKVAPRKFKVKSIESVTACACAPTPTCGAITGAKARNSLEYPDCKCESADDKVKCGNQVVADRKFNATRVYMDLRSALKSSCVPKCAYAAPTCEAVPGATGRNSEEYPQCKCASDAHKVMCGNEVMADRKFNATKVLDTGSSCVPVCA